MLERFVRIGKAKKRLILAKHLIGNLIGELGWRNYITYGLKTKAMLVTTFFGGVKTMQVIPVTSIMRGNTLKRRLLLLLAMTMKIRWLFVSEPLMQLLLVKWTPNICTNLNNYKPYRERKMKEDIKRLFELEAGVVRIYDGRTPKTTPIDDVLAANLLSGEMADLGPNIVRRLQKRIKELEVATAPHIEEKAPFHEKNMQLHKANNIATEFLEIITVYNTIPSIHKYANKALEAMREALKGVDCTKDYEPLINALGRAVDNANNGPRTEENFEIETLIDEKVAAHFESLRYHLKKELS